jgi:outer membrane protein TolC
MNKNAGQDLIETQPNKNLNPSQALRRGAIRSAAIRDRVLEALRSIESQVASASDAARSPNRLLSLAEVCRRAGVHSTTMYTDAQRDFGVEVTRRLDALKRPSENIDGVARPDAEKRITDWRKMYYALAQTHRDTELALQQAESDLQQLREVSPVSQIEFERIQLALTQAEKEMAQLHERLRQVENSNVVSFPSKKD